MFVTQMVRFTFKKKTLHPLRSTLYFGGDLYSVGWLQKITIKNPEDEMVGKEYTAEAIG